MWADLSTPMPSLGDAMAPAHPARSQTDLAAQARPAAGRPGRATRHAPLWAPALLSLLLAACASPGPEAPPAALRDAASLGLSPPGGRVAVATEPLPLAPDWWQAFGDAQLDTLVAQALAGHPSLQLAQARLARARAAGELAEAATQPQLSGGVDLTRQRYTANGAVPAPLAGSIRETGTAQLSASWELDFFGRHRAALDAALGSARAAEADAQAARSLLASQVVRAYVQWLRVQAQLEVAQRTLAQRQETLALVQDRVRAGLDTRLELSQSEAGLPDARQQIEALHEQAALARHAIAALTGQSEAAPALDPSSLNALKTIALAERIPANLLGQRPDIVAARWRVEAATQDVASARALFYPNVNLVAFAGLSSIGLGRLLDAGSQQWGVGPALRLPLFDAGRLRANLRGKAADLDAAVESYNAAVLDAVREVADQVASAQSLVRQQAEQRQAQAAAETAYQIAVQRYQAGLGNHLQVLSAESGVLAQRRLAVDLQARALDTQAALARALGGGLATPALQAAQVAPRAAQAASPTPPALAGTAVAAQPPALAAR